MNALLHSSKKENEADNLTIDGIQLSGSLADKVSDYFQNIGTSLCNREVRYNVAEVSEPPFLIPTDEYEDFLKY